MNVLEQIAKLVPPRDVLLSKEERAYASIDYSTNVAASFPKAVVRVNSTEELIAVVQLCLKHAAPVVMRGAGTGKSGGAVGDEHSIVIDTTRLNRIVLIDKNDLIAIVEPGVVLSDLQDAVMAEGLFYPPDPASSHMCTIGGNVAENAAGPSTLKYGSTKDYLLGGQAIIGTGEVIDFGKRCVKGVAGYDIPSLLCGSEGSLAVFTQFIVRLLPLPKSFAQAMVYFADEHEALRAVNAVLNNGFLPKTLEYVDDVCLSALADLVGFVRPEKSQAALIIECDANYPGGADHELKSLCDMLKNYGAVSTVFAHDEAARKDLWQRRSLLSEACTKYRGHKISEDIAVPLGAIAKFGAAVKDLARGTPIIIGLFGHAGDGNLHVQLMFDDPAHKARAQIMRHEIVLLVLSLHGTITAEHGVGLQKKSYLPLEQKPALIELQKRIKKAFDPHHLLNPGKIFM